MSQDSRSSPVEPLSVGNIVSSGFQLYREKFQEYLPIALAAVGWSLLPILGLIVLGLIVAVIMGASQQPVAGAGLGVLGFVAIIVLAVFCSAKSLANSALITRLAFGELTNEPEALTEARRFTNSRKWSFFAVQIWVGLIASGLVLGVYIIAALIGFALFVAVGGVGGGSPNPGLMIIGGGLLLLIIVVAIAAFFWLSARLFGAAVPLAIEPQILPLQSIKRFWSLTKGNVWRVFLVLLITFTITLPLYLIAQVISIIPQGLVLALVRDNPSALAIGNALSSLIGYAVGLLLSVVVLPLWQIIQAAVYYDLRTRREGFGLKLRDR
ncbi:MAG: hypothetical protein DCF22_08165 [Leptolyngbya sp.]|nr:MAG: hypothetical protein DCF22_08165 [Leptolyngbya sp.]